MSSEPGPPVPEPGDRADGTSHDETNQAPSSDEASSAHAAANADGSTDSGDADAGGPPDAAANGSSTPDAGPTTPRRQLPNWLMRTVRWLTSANPFMITALSIFSALVIGAILIVIGDRPVMSTFSYFFARPSTALSGAWQQIRIAYTNLFEGAVFNPSTVGAAINGTATWEQALRPISETLTYAAPLILTGLAVAFAFRGGLFNIGAQGQAVFGVIGAGLVGLAIKLPVGLHFIVALIAGAIAGALWGFIPGFLKARTGAHEVIVTIMMNYIALLFLGWLILQRGVKDPKQLNAISKPLHDSATLPPILGSSLRTNVGLIVGLLMTFVIAWLINRSTLGFEVRAVGLNPDAARTAGMSVGRTFILVMVIAGALGGLGGAVQLLGTASAVTGQVTGNVGFDGITVALLGRGKPWGVVLAALLFGALYAGGNQMQSNAGVVIDLVQVLQALIVIFIAAPALIASIYRLRPVQGAQATANLAKGW